MRDSAGRELTEAQQAYFKDSKVRDADGKLLVMYHQTDGTFTVFDTKHKGAGAGDDETPFGIFLKRTPRNIGVRGEKQMELYADIRNPLRVRDRTELVSKLRELSVDYARLKDKSAQIDKEYGAKFEKAKNAFKSFLIQWRKNNPDAPPRAAYDADGFDAAFNAEDNVVKEWTRAKDELALRAKTSITQALRDNGYDGVILENDKGSWGRSTDAYIALDANQVKNTTNKTTTADPDIRYQQRDNLKEEYHLTDDEESAIISYKSGDSYTLNGKLTAKAELTEYQRKLRDNLDAALEKLPVYRGEVYRHYNFDDFGGFDAMMEFLELFEKNEPTALGGYLSCSTVRNEDRTGGKYTVNMVVQSDNGRRLAGFGRNTENEILLPRDTKLVPYRMERMGPTSIRVYVREETISDAGKTNDSALSGVRGMRKGTQGSENLRQVSGGNPGKVQSEVGRSAGRNGDCGGMSGLREGEGSASLDATGVEENHRGYETRGGEGEGVKKRQQARNSPAASFAISDIPLGVHIEHAAGGDAQSGDYRQSHEAQGHERVDVPGHAQAEGLVLGALQSAVDHDQGIVTHDACDGQGHLAQDLAVLHHGDATVIFRDAVGGGGHLLLVGAHHDDVVGIVGDAGGHGASLQAVALDVAQADVMGVLMPLNHGHLQNVILHVDMVDVARVLGDDLPGHQADDGVGTAVLEILRRQLAQVEGIVGAVDQVGIDLRGGEVPQLAIVHQLAPLIDHLNVEIIEIVDDHKVGQVAGGDGAAVIE